MQVFDNASRRTANANGDTEAGELMFGSLYFILITTGCQVRNTETDVFCACVRAFPYTSRINFKHLLSY